VVVGGNCAQGAATSTRGRPCGRSYRRGHRCEARGGESQAERELPVRRTPLTRVRARLRTTKLGTHPALVGLRNLHHAAGWCESMNIQLFLWLDLTDILDANPANLSSGRPVMPPNGTSRNGYLKGTVTGPGARR
jgi:hypothetical protein